MILLITHTLLCTEYDFENEKESSSMPHTLPVQDNHWVIDAGG